MQKYLLIIIALFALATLSAFNNPNIKELGLVENYGSSSEKFSFNSTLSGNDNIPDSILIFLVEFADVKFDTIPDFPDYLAHDHDYFHRLMFHMSAYWSDASYGKYKIVDGDNSLYTICDEIFTLPNPMSYYGEESGRGDMIERKIQMVSDLLELADDTIDFNNYDTFMMFHAGAGQEGNTGVPELIQSTFLSRKSFQAALDPENDEFPGIITDDGTIFSEITIFPESENLADIEEGDNILGLLGIIAQGFGYQIGLPTLFDNVSSNGTSFGIGSFGVMSYGVWNAAGYVPPLPCAWSRYFLGWEDDNIIEISSDQEMLTVAYPQSDDEDTSKLYKIDISEKEYFLLENRQQNPDNSYFVNADNDTLVTFTFATIEDQEVYPFDHPFAGEPKFMFMENTYEGCEWDFFLPGYGGGDDPDLDGSGILIWHIDENIIEANFTSNFDHNSVNGDASHKGVDLEEADGVQHMDSFNQFALGTKDDSYREGNNSYFGKMHPAPGVFSLPTSESYYGGGQIEIYDIGASVSIMTFSVRFAWFLNSDYSGENHFNAAVINFDDDDDMEIFYPMPDGSLYLWKDYILAEDYPLLLDSLAAYYAYDEFSQTFLIPTFNPSPPITRGCFLNDQTLNYPIFVDLCWASNPLVNPDEFSEFRAFLPFNDSNGSNAIIKIYNSSYEEINEIEFNEEIIASNLILNNNILYTITMNSQLEYYLNSTDLNVLSIDNVLISGISGEESITTAVMADINSDSMNELILTTADTLLYVFDLIGDVNPGFPVKIPLASISYPSIGDIDGNGLLDIIIGGRNSFIIVDKNGEISKPHVEIDSPDSLYSAAGVTALDIDDDDQLEIVGNMSRNRFSVWENLNNNTFEMKHGYPVSFGDPSSNYPIVVNTDDNSSIIYFAANNGTMYKQDMSINILQNYWMTEYGDLQRTASYRGPAPSNIYTTDKVFVKEQTYIYPNPLSVIFNNSIFNGSIREKTLTVKVMTGVDTEVKIRVFDIAGNLVMTEKQFCEAYVDNSIFIDAKKLSSGIYFANLYSQGETLKLKFAIEK